LAGPRAVSSAHGPLAHLLFLYPARAARQPSFRRVYAELFARLPATTRLTVLVEPASEADLRELVTATCPEREVSVVVAPDAMRFSVWAQDPFVAVGRGGAELGFLEPAWFHREDDVGVATAWERAGVGRVVSSSLRFHGAHVLVGDDFALVGRDCLDASDGQPEAFERELGMPAVFVGTDLPVPQEELREVDGRVNLLHEGVGEAQPLAHLDMFVSLAGRAASGAYRLLVGSPALADEILGRTPVEHSLADLFDDVAESLAGEGFDVIRNPLPLTHADGRRTVEGVWRDVRRWYWASANNCLVQIDPGASDAVWLPTYGHGAWRELAATDEANREIWSALGFEVHELDDCHGPAQSGGSVHCLAKELER
jgi:hypothetical protein